MKITVTLITNGYADNKALAEQLLKVAEDLADNDDGGYHKSGNWEWYIEMD